MPTLAEMASARLTAREPYGPTASAELTEKGNPATYASANLPAITAGSQRLAALTPSYAEYMSANFPLGEGAVPLTAMRATNAGFAPVPENSPSSGLAQTTRAVSAPFNEPFREFELVYQVYRIRTVSVTAKIDDGAGAAGDILEVTAVGTGAIYPGVVITGTGVTAGTYVLSQLTGTEGGIGTYQVSVVQAGVVASGTITSTQLVEELFQGPGAEQTYEAGFEDVVTEALTGIPNRTRVTFDGGATSKAYAYASWDKTTGHFVSDKMNRGRLSADPLAIWTRVTLPSAGFGLPANKLACGNFENRWWGNDLQGAGASADPITATSITAVASATPTSTTLCIVPTAIRIYTAGVAKTVVLMGDSRAAFTGLGVNEPAGYGDCQGDIYGLGSEMERGIHDIAQQHSLVLAKPSDRAFWLARSPNSWRFRKQIAGACGDADAKIVVNALGQNDQSDAPTAWSSNMVLFLGQGITTSSRVYVVTVAGTSGAVAPTSTTLGVNITLGTATIRYYGTDATATNRTGLALAGKNSLLNAALRAAMSGVSIVQEGIGPFTSTTDNWATAANQSDGFNSAAGKTYQAQLAALGATWTGADRVVSTMSLMAGSRTVDGGADDGTRSWKSDGTTAYLMTPDGIHRGNYGAEVGKAAWTKLAVSGAA